MTNKNYFGFYNEDLKKVLKNKHERDFYNFCVTGNYRTVEHNVEVKDSCGYSKISVERATEIATMADKARDNSKPVQNLFAYCLVR